ncbi:N-acetyldiaminopimelate deacetylase [Agrilactobacillus composti DSM 18527 = JCM 14202]|uniref:N-acetyldiaminopimelate deacetylase n=1 Tax=Agrilactobacillus composti DSM 18527 = JCM 14202 TaxID=1423734 RepID=X0PEH2_9LACO|nr:N-acetyldiaminopimelate deacetylase [Agrilactobacillus composti]KRM32441.1 N-acetyldiaminopimelate deacetylase [Agrilactobacillus composti DSM 18527 = JCM 14202]GAF39863.1 N-acetyl-L,L-diaminopimelate deacetylase [Agrilactobacillus composti DSM 18527 = JCM 14202]
MLSDEKLIQIRRELHQIPEIGLEEFETQALLLKIIKSFPQDNLTIKTHDTGILVHVTGKKSDYTIAYRTDIDGLPVTEATGLPYASKHPGRMHACGHDIHMTVALGLLSSFASKQPEHNFLFIFQPAEENASGGKLLYESGALNEWLPDEIYGLHDNPQLPTGAIGCRLGTLFAGTCEIHITLHGKSGHAAYPHLANDMVVVGAELVTQLQTIVSRNVDPIEGGVVTLGHFEAGTTMNVIAGTAQIDGTIRALTQKMNLHIQKRVREIVAGLEVMYDCKADLDLHQGGYLPVENNPELTKNFIDFMTKQPNVNFIETQPAMTGEDFGFMLSKIKGTMFWLGVDSPYALHSDHLAPHEAAIGKGIAAIEPFLRYRDKQVGA